MTELLLIRHGQSEADLLDRFEGHANYSLTTLGRHQANRLAEWVFSNYKPSILFSSPLNRARETAEALSVKLQLPIQFDDAIIEQTNGVLDGTLKEKASLKHPLPPGGWKRYEAIEGGENVILLRARAENFISRIIVLLEENSDLKSLCIVAHGSIISMLFRSFLNLPYDSQVFLPTGDTGVHIWNYDNGNKTILKTNSLEHLS